MTAVLDATTTPFSLSALTAARGNASKRLISGAHGYPVKDPAHSLGISAGRIEHVRVAGLTGFADLLQHVTQQQALVHGIPKGSNPGDLYTLVLAEHYTGAPGTIARTLACIDYPPGVRLLMLDYDPDPAASATIASAHELMARLTGIWPALTDVGWLATTSTSSAIRDKLTREWLRPPEGMHVYVLTTGDVVYFREWLKVKLWLADYGFCKLATPNVQTGVAAVLERAMVDLMVFSPERLDYVAGAIIDQSASFFQDRPTPELHPGLVLDLDALPDVTAEERTEYVRLVAEAHNRLVPGRRAKVYDHITRVRPSLPAAEVEREITTRLDRAERGQLEPGHLLCFDNGKTLTAGELTQAKALDGRRLADPQEPTYRQGDDAVFHWRHGDWRIVSWAHGTKKVYRLVSPAPLPGRPLHDPWLGDRRQWHGVPLAVRRVAP